MMRLNAKAWLYIAPFVIIICLAYIVLVCNFYYQKHFGTSVFRVNLFLEEPNGAPELYHISWASKFTRKTGRGTSLLELERANAMCQRANAACPEAVHWPTKAEPKNPRLITEAECPHIEIAPDANDCNDVSIWSAAFTHAVMDANMQRDAEIVQGYILQYGSVFDCILAFHRQRNSVDRAYEAGYDDAVSAILEYGTVPPEVIEHMRYWKTRNDD